MLLFFLFVLVATFRFLSTRTVRNFSQSSGTHPFCGPIPLLRPLNMFPQGTVVRCIRSEMMMLRMMDPTLMGSHLMAQRLHIPVAVTVYIVFQGQLVGSDGKVVIEDIVPPLMMALKWTVTVK